MKTTLIIAVFALFACQLTAARSVSEKNAHQECALETVDRIKTNVIGRVEGVITRLDVVRGIYDECRSRPSDEVQECLREFAQTAVSYMQQIMSEMPAMREGVIEYLLARLDDYYNCRVATYADVMTNRLERPCEQELLGEVRERFGQYLAMAMSRMEQLRSAFTGCARGPEENRATCLVQLFGEAREVVTNAILAVQERREQILAQASEMLQSYYVCRVQRF